MTEIIFDVYYVFDLCERVNGENIRIKSGWIFFSSEEMKEFKYFVRIIKL